MGRNALDCREMPSEMNCTVMISADQDGELVEAGVQHAVSVHGHEDTPELRETLQGMVKDDASA